MKNLRNLLFGAMVCILTLSISFANIGDALVAAFALNTSGPVLGASTTINIPTKVEMGDNVYLEIQPDSVTAPDGNPVTLTQVNDNTDPHNGDYTFVANQIGHYSLRYDNGVDAFYKDFSIYCYTKYEPVLKVDYNGADIDTVAAWNQVIELPSAKLVYYDDDGIEQLYDGVDGISTVADPAKVLVEVTSENSITVNHNATSGIYSFVTPEDNTTIFVRYSYRSDRVVYMFADYSVKVQKNFEDKTVPRISMTAPAKEINVNAKYELYKATVTSGDTFDKNIKIVISVTQGGNPVRQATIDPDTGYATGIADLAPVVEFDNDRNMYFYPTIADEYYQISYIAYGDNGLPSIEHKFTVKAVDTLPPVYGEFDDWKIPSVWGLSVSRRTNEQNADPTPVNPGTVAGDAQDERVIRFPLPTNAYDNSSASDKLTCSFMIQNSKNVTIYNITNILAEAGSDDAVNKIKNMGHDGLTLADGFSFNLYNNKVNDENIYSEYTVTYRLRDEKTQSTTKTYKIELRQSFEDTSLPTVDLDNMDAYLINNDDLDFVIPTPVVSDDQSPRPRVQFTVTNNASPTADTMSLKGGERITKNKIDDEDFSLTDKLTFECTVTDNVGNVRTLGSRSITILDETAGVDFTFVAASLQTKDGTDPFEVATPANLGDITIGYSEATQADFVGFELLIRQPDIDGNAGQGSVVNRVALTTWQDRSSNEINIADITFTPAIAGEYALFVRALHVNGSTAVYTHFFDVEASTDGDWVTRPASTVIQNISKDIEVNNGTRLPSYEYTGTGTDYFVRTIEGPAFTLIGNEIFTPRAVGTFSFLDTASGGKILGTKYYTASSDNSIPTIQLTASIAPYIARSATVAYQLPSAVASSGTQNATFDKPVVKHKDVTTVNVDWNATTKTWSFLPAEDGFYTITYTAKIGDKTGSAKYTISVGDVTAPIFTLDKHAPERLENGASFDFAKIVIAAGEDETGYTFSKKNIQPDQTVMSGSEINNSKDRINNGSSYVFEQSGKYEIIYTVRDAAGNEATIKDIITVGAAVENEPIPLIAISTALVVVGVLLVIGAFVYFIRFRKVRE